MEYENILERFSKSVSKEDPNRELINQIDRIKSELDAKYWSSSNIFTLLDTLYGDLNTNQQKSILNERNKLQNLHTSEDNDKNSLKNQFKNIVSSQSETIIEQQSDRLLRRVLAEKNAARRQSIKSELDSALDGLLSDLKKTNFDLKSAKIAIATGNKTRLSKQLDEFSAVLDRRGWNKEDLEELTENAIDEGQKPVQYFDELENRTRVTFDFIVFLPILSVKSNFIGIHSDFEIHTDGDLDASSLPNASMLSSATSDLLSTIQDTLDSETSIEFQVNAWETEEAKKKAADKVSQFLDSCAGIHQAAYLEDPQYQGRFKYMVWRSDQKLPPFISMFRDPDMPASLSTKQLEHVDEVFSTVQSKSALANRLARGIHYFRKGNIAYRDVDTTVNYIASLETLTTDVDSVRDDIYTNILQYARVLPSAEDRIVDHLDRLYGLRNAALHSGTDETINESDISVVQGLLSTVIWDMVKFLGQKGGGTLVNYEDYVSRDIAGKYRHLYGKVSNNGLQLNHQYSGQGEAISQNSSTEFEFDIDLEFVEKDEYIWIDVGCLNISETWNSISSDQLLEIQFSPVPGTKVELGKVKAIHFMHSDTASLEFRSFDTV